MARELGGADCLDNVVSLCAECHRLTRTNDAAMGRTPGTPDAARPVHTSRPGAKKIRLITSAGLMGGRS